jgi:phosphate transport system protein
MGASRGQFGRQLEAIEARVIELLGMVIEDLALATQALLYAPGGVPDVLAGREQFIDSVCVEIEGLAAREILLQAPVASDLRLLLTVLRVVPELERSHDLIVHVASRGSRVPGGSLPPRVSWLTRQMADLALVMWRRAADAWYARDQSSMPALGRHRDEMGELRASLSAEVAAGRVPVLAAMEMALAARDYDRLGAHALNVARRVSYLAGSAGRPPAGGG